MAKNGNTEKKGDVGTTAVAPPDDNTLLEVEEPQVPVLDAEVGDLSTKRRRGEKHPPILEGSWVRIGQHDDVDEKFWGHLAVVIQSRHYPCTCNWSEEPHTHQDEDRDLTVRTRDEYNATIVLPLDAIAEKAQDRATLHPFA